MSRVVGGLQWLAVSATFVVYVFTPLLARLESMSRGDRRLRRRSGVLGGLRTALLWIWPASLAAVVVAGIGCLDLSSDWGVVFFGFGLVTQSAWLMIFLLRDAESSIALIPATVGLVPVLELLVRLVQMPR